MDMTKGSLWNKILIFALPLAACSILQQLFNSADVAVVGRFAGSEALAAVGGNGSVIALLINLFTGLSVGANVVISAYVGKKDKDKVKEAVHTVFVVALLSGGFLVLLGGLVAEPLLTIMGTPKEVLRLAVLYLRIYFCGMPFAMIYNFGSAILRSVGDTRRPLYCLILSGIINVILNLIFVVGFRLSVVGVALATVLANGVSATLMVYYLTHAKGEQEIIRLDLHSLRLKREHVISVIKIGAPAGIQGMVFSFSNVCIQSGINSFGTNAIAGSSIELNYEYITYFMSSAFAQSAVTFTSQNFAAGEYQRCRKVWGLCSAFGIGITGLMSLICVGGREFFIGIFSKSPLVAEFASIRFLRVELFEWMTCIYEVMGGVLRGRGKSLTPALITLFGSCGLRMLWIYTVFEKYNSFSSLMTVYPVSWIITSIGMFVAFIYIWKKSTLFFKITR